MRATLRKNIKLCALSATLLNPIASAGEYHITEFDSEKVIATVEFQTEAIFTLNDVVYRLEREKEGSTLAKSKALKIPKIEIKSASFADQFTTIRMALAEVEKQDGRWILLAMGDRAFYDQQIDAFTLSNTSLHDVCLQLAERSGSRIRFDDDSISFIQKTNSNEPPEVVVPIGEDRTFEIKSIVYRLRPTEPTKARLTAQQFTMKIYSINNTLVDLCFIIDYNLQHNAPKKGLQKANCTADSRVEDLRCGDFSVSNMSMERAIVLLAEHTNTTAVFDDTMIRFEPKSD